jgi:hypothetical protein
VLKSDLSKIPVLPPAPALPPNLRWSANRIAVIYLVLAILLLPWLILLAIKLPDRQINLNYRLAWVGFDVMLMLTLSRTAWLAWRRSPYLVIVASMTATLLIVDAWFDITTAGSERERYLAIATAVLIELPLAAFSMRLARRAQQMIAGALTRARLIDAGWPASADPDTGC